MGRGDDEGSHSSLLGSCSETMCISFRQHVDYCENTGLPVGKIDMNVKDTKEKKERERREEGKKKENSKQMTGGQMLPLVMSTLST